MPSDPNFSIIIPTLNRPARLVSCLEGMIRLDYPPDRFEVIVVDDGGSIPLNGLVDQYKTQIKLHLIKQTNSGPAAARNAGARQAKGQFLAFTDDDCVPDSNWLTALEEGFDHWPECALGGKLVNALPRNIYSTASYYLVDYIYSYYNSDANRMQFFASNNIAVPANRFHKIGGFNTTFHLAGGEDREFCNRWLFHGYQLRQIQAAIIHHSHFLWLKTFWRQHFNYGRGAFRYHKIRSDREQGKIKLEPWHFYGDLLNSPFSRGEGWRSLPLMMLLGISQAANALGFLYGATYKK